MGVAIPGIRHHSAIRLRESNWPASSDFPVPSPKWMTSGANGPGCPSCCGGHNSCGRPALQSAGRPGCLILVTWQWVSWSPLSVPTSLCPAWSGKESRGQAAASPPHDPPAQGLNGAVIKGAAVGLGGTWRGLALGLWHCGADLWRTELELGGHEVCMSTAPARSPGFLGRSCWGIRAPWAPQAQPLRTTAAAPHHCLHFHILQRGTSPSYGISNLRTCHLPEDQRP